MPFYPKLKRSNYSKEIKTRTVNNLLKLKKQLAEEIPQKNVDKHLLLATWNIRDLGKNGAKHGKRNLEDLFYIAEILSAFDIIAVQEVNDLYDWDIVMEILGRDWDYIATDVSEWESGGNGERMTFVYDRRKVWFQNIAGEIVLSKSDLISENISTDNADHTPKRQFARTPFLVSFQAGWFHFDLCTVHIYFGAESGQKLERRKQEIEKIAEEISERAELAFKNHKDAMILLGDFNIVHPEHKTMEALKDSGFVIPKNIEKPSNVNNNKYYDQIALKTNDESLLEFIEDEVLEEPNAGIFDLFRIVMKSRDWPLYIDEMKKTTEGKKLSTDDEFLKYFKKWRTYHLSDHKPMWIRIPVDKSEDYIKSIIED